MLHKQIKSPNIDNCKPKFSGYPLLAVDYGRSMS